MTPTQTHPWGSQTTDLKADVKIDNHTCVLSSQYTAAVILLFPKTDKLLEFTVTAAKEEGQAEPKDVPEARTLLRKL